MAQGPQGWQNGDSEAATPLWTWLVGGAALVIAIAAGALLLGGKRADESRAVEPEAAPKTAAEPSPIEELTPKSPLDVSGALVDAQARSRVWSDRAILSSIRVLVEDGNPHGAVEFEFGQTIGATVPRAPLSTKRQVLTYQGTKVEERFDDASDNGIGLPDPNCPLEVAFRKLGESGVSTKSRITVRYTFSEKHARAIWQMTDVDEKITNIDADSCALLR